MEGASDSVVGWFKRVLCQTPHKYNQMTYMISTSVYILGLKVMFFLNGVAEHKYYPSNRRVITRLQRERAYIIRNKKLPPERKKWDVMDQEPAEPPPA